MSNRLGDVARIKHILDAIEEIINYTKDIDFEGFNSNSMMKNATIRQLEVIGEASNRLTEELKNTYPQTAWRQIISLRNILIHQYFGVDFDLVWEIIQNDLLVFKNQVSDILIQIEPS